MKKLLATSVLAVALASVAALALEDGPFTADQARGGAASYAANCAGCHGARLQGAGEAPPLAGASFMAAWGNRTTEEFYNLIKTSMPYGNGNSLDAATYRSITAYVFTYNGAKAGNTALAGTEKTRIAAVADGKTPANLAQAPVPAAAREQPATSYPPGRFGLTVAGELKSYNPVTDAMLAKPADADWLMYRRNYQGWSHSPLGQITTANVKDLQLVWSWAMNDGGASQVTPIVHDGVMFLSNVANTVQALVALSTAALVISRAVNVLG